MNKISSYNLFRLGYIIFPFISFLFALKNYKKPWFKNALWLFIVFFGFSMSFLETIDAYVYKNIFEDFIKFSDFQSIFDVFDSSKTGRVDPAVSIINYLLTRFSTNYHLLFGVYGLIFGFFYSRNIDFVIKQTSRYSSKSILGLIIFLSFYIGFWNINGFRFWTATHIFIYGLINHIYLKNKFKGNIFLLISLAFHFSFLLPLVVFFVSKYIPRYNKIYLITTLLLALYNPLNDLSFVEKYVSQYTFNEQLEKKVEVYTSNETQIKSLNSSAQTNPIKIAGNFFIKGFVLLLAWYTNQKRFFFSNKEKKMFDYGIILTLVGAILSFIPSVGTRFTIVGVFILLLAIIVIIINNNLFLNKRKLISKTGYLCAASIVITNIWILFTFSIHTILGNYLTIFLDSSEIFYSIGDLIIDIYK